jgi:magnesium transporter
LTDIPSLGEDAERDAATNLLYALQGLMQAEERHGFEGDGFVYLKNPLWWAGIATRKAVRLC